MLRLPVDKSSLICLGMMSGTSGDGIDTAIVHVDLSNAQWTARVQASQTHEYTQEMQHLLDNADRLGVADVAEANFLLGQRFADAALDTMAEAGLSPDQIDLIASHGHTLYHDPPQCTLQVGEGSVIAERTGCLTVSDFRPADLAAGGQGAPLVPRIDALLFCPPGSGIVAVNLGGIANVTYCPDGDNVIAFDTGPGNALIDAAIRDLSKGARRYDKNGALAASGDADEAAVERFIQSDNYFRRPAPKSTGRHYFGDAALRRLQEIRQFSRIEDLVATATRITARTLVEALDAWVFPAGPVKKVLVSGGGAHNATLLSAIRAGLAGVPVEPLSQDGFTVENKEAGAFAILGAMTLRGIPGNVPAATGAGAPAILGKLSFPHVKGPQR